MFFKSKEVVSRRVMNFPSLSTSPLCNPKNELISYKVNFLLNVHLLPSAYLVAGWSATVGQ